jgi:hypothetical protein
MKCSNCGHDADESLNLTYELSGGGHDAYRVKVDDLCGPCADAAARAVDTVLGIMKRRP